MVGFVLYSGRVKTLYQTLENEAGGTERFYIISRFLY